MSLEGTFQEAFPWTIVFAGTADRMRAAYRACQIRAEILETASRIVFLRTHRMGEREQLFPSLSDAFQPAIFALN